MSPGFGCYLAFCLVYKSSTTHPIFIEVSYIEILKEYTHLNIEKTFVDCCVTFVNFECFRLPLYLAGMSVHHVKVGDLRVCYAERGKYKPGTSSLIFIHGFSASKDMWPQVLKVCEIKIKGD